MKDVLEKSLNRVFNEDILKVLRGLPDNSLDMVYGDPDYNVGINYAGKNKNSYFVENYLHINSKHLES